MAGYVQSAAVPKDAALCAFIRKTSMHLHSAGNLTAAQATGANVDMLRCPVHYGLDAFYVGLPCTVGTSVGVGYLYAKGYTLVADPAFSHIPAPPLSETEIKESLF